MAALPRLRQLSARAAQSAATAAATAAAPAPALATAASTLARAAESTRPVLALPRRPFLSSLPAGAVRGLATTTTSPVPPVTQNNHGAKGPTAMVFLNMGGPSTTDEVGDFLTRLFSDGDLIPLGRLQNYMGRFIARRRTPKIQKQYAAIGGGSPIRRWSEYQCAAMCRLLDELSPETAPHRPYVAFRYANPLTEDTYRQLLADGFGGGRGGRAVAFTQYPQYSCSTTGSSLNELWKWRHRLEGASPTRGTDGLDAAATAAATTPGSIAWSVIDRWPAHPGLVEAFAENIEAKLAEYPTDDRRRRAVLLFSAHSLPMTVVNRGDPYPAEVAATVHAVVQRLAERQAARDRSAPSSSSSSSDGLSGLSNPYRLCWQSQVGPQPWLGPQTQAAVDQYVARGQTDLVLIPIAFTSDHIETLFELDEEVIGSSGHPDSVKRAESLNGSPTFVRALADIARDHLAARTACSAQMGLRCPGCNSSRCLESKRFFAEQASRL